MIQSLTNQLKEEQEARQRLENELKQLKVISNEISKKVKP